LKDSACQDMTQMLTESGERTLMMMRPVRLKNLRYYILLIVFVILAGYLQWFRSSWLPNFEILGRSVYDFIEVLLIFVALILLLVAEVRRLFQQYLVTNMRVIDTYGLIRKSTTVMMTNQIERVYTSQGILQRLLRFGDVVVDTGEDQIILEGVRQPVKVEGAITQAMASRYPGK